MIEHISSGSDRSVDSRGQVFFSYGFRTFFLLAGFYAAAAMAIWALWFVLLDVASELVSELPLLPQQLHAHEMIFGYVMAVIAGFLLTAIPGWTNARPLQGNGLKILLAVWLAGRVAIACSPWLPIAIVAFFDLLFVPALMIPVALGLMKQPAPRNLIFLGLLALFWLGNLLTYTELLGWTSDGIAVGHLLALDTAIVLISIVGGRVTPSFTLNDLRSEGHDRLPLSHPLLDGAAIMSVAAVLVADLIWPGELVTGAVALVASIVNFVRLLLWRGLATRRKPILWILHMSYLWIVIGLALKGISLVSGLFEEVAAMHALWIGGVGGMTIGVMSRAALGHTGRVLKAPQPIVVAYVLISVSAILRVSGAVFLVDYYTSLMMAAALIWTIAFTLFVWVFWPILTTPGLDTAAAAS